MFVPLRVLRFHVQISVAQEAFPQTDWCLLHRKSCPPPLLELNPAPGVSSRDHNGEAGLKSELQRVRAMAEARIKSGSIPDWSWQQHVQLIEAVDAMLHDISLAENARPAKRYAGGPLRLVTENPEKPRVRRKTGAVH
jgi:hypothetical protein